MLAIEKTLKTLKKRWPHPGAMDLCGGTLPAETQAFRTIVGVVLSARTRDEQVLALLPAFFERFPDAASLARATEADIRARIDTIGMYKQKAKNLKRLGAALEEQFGGRVPRTMDELTSLAGVGRKTASVVLAACFGTPAIAVDTHVHRVTNRLGWVKTKTPEKTEAALLKIVPERLQPTVNKVFVKHGRYVCLPGNPRCWTCPVRDLCAFKGKRLTPPPNAAEVEADIARREASLEASRRAVAGITK